ncbi:MAG: hypothetical protein E6K81_05645 [Candidatus Eisenbacteria bacterium]|uniref:Glycosyltransferase RgtA/B/C/D-like domain-containing protein n=1 Tax=Eiseniibacteriota bacterium TaxID=2212470 RepID=A0A538UBN6_UNCEI|nr:MAG: hypothetical protein E6K81_05645 [Candidatus Eisenbacteria bacterium]
MQTLYGPMTRVERWALALGLVLAAALMWPLRHYLTDDTFIHLRYASNVAAGRGLVFNVGERVYGCTSPLWVTLLADAIAIGFDGLTAARVIGMAAALASVGLFLQLMRRTVPSPSVRAAATLAWAGHAWMIRWSTSGMETSLATTLTLAGFVAFTEGSRWGARPLRTGALWSLAALARPEAVFLLLLWGVFLLIEADNREGLRRLVLGTLAPVCVYGGWVVFARLYFHTFWPQTLVAKTAGAEGVRDHAENLWRMARIVGATDGVLAAVLVLALLVGARRMWRSPAPSQRLVPWAWLLGLPAFYASRGVPVISRYLVPSLPVLGWLAWRAAERWWAGEQPGPARRRLVAVAAAALTVLVLAQNLVVYRTQVLPHVRTFTPALERSLIAWGRWFDRHTPQDAVIATPDIGAIGYFGRRRVIDLAGLVTPEMVPGLQRESQEDAVAGFYFASFARPDYLVDRAAVGQSLMTRSPYHACLEPLGDTYVPNLGVSKPEPVIYSFYRVDWAVFDSLRARR